MSKTVEMVQSVSSVAQSCVTLCGPMDCSTPGFPVHHQLPESAQTHVHQVGDAIQPSHPLSSLLLPPSIFPSIRVFSNELALPISGPSIEASASASVISAMNIHSWFPLGSTGLTSLQFRGLSRVFSNTTVQKHQFFGAQPSLWSNSHVHTWLLEKPYLWLWKCLEKSLIYQQIFIYWAANFVQALCQQ